MKKTCTTVYLDERHLHRIKDMAIRMGVPQAVIIRAAIDLFWSQKRDDQNLFNLNDPLSPLENFAEEVGLRLIDLNKQLEEIKVVIDRFNEEIREG